MFPLLPKVLLNPQALFSIGFIITTIVGGGVILYQKAELAEANLQVEQYNIENQKLKHSLQVANSNKDLRENEIEILNRKILEDTKSFEQTCELLKEIENENDPDPVGKILDRLSDSATDDGK